jgi:hypothetical protein
MLPVETPVCANPATEDRRSAERVIKASSVKRTPGREKFRFNIVTFLSELLLRNGCTNSQLQLSS